jgi:large subunit ribosomal protein L32
MANPKYKTSHSKTRRRRANIIFNAPNIINCPKCHEPKLAHRICTACGYYNGREVIKLETGKE